LATLGGFDIGDIGCRIIQGADLFILATTFILVADSLP